MNFYPQSVCIDASTLCQLKCPVCPTSQGKIRKTLGGGKLSLDMLRTIIAKAPWITSVELSNWGEIFLNQHLPAIMAYCFDIGVHVTMENGVNLNTVKDSTLEDVVKYRVRIMRCSLDGASQEVYSKYRVNGNFDQVIANIKRINQFKAVYKSEYPKLIWQFVAMKQNIHEIDAARDMAKELGMTFDIKPCWEEELAVHQYPDGTPIQFRSKRLQWDHAVQDLWHGACRQLWKKPRINFDGRVLGCSEIYWGDFGKISGQNDLHKILNGETFNDVKKMLIGKAAPKAGNVCEGCDAYDYIIDHKDYVKIERWKYIVRQYLRSWLPIRKFQKLSNLTFAWMHHPRSKIDAN